MKSAYTEFTILMFLFSLSKIPAAPLLSQDTFTYIGNSFYSNTSHVRTELSAPLLGDIVGFCSRNCFRDLECYGFELCTLSGGNEICRLTNGVAMGSFDFTAGEICKHYYMVRVGSLNCYSWIQDFLQTNMLIFFLLQNCKFKLITELIKYM